MVGSNFSRRSLAMCVAVLSSALLASPALAQNGQVRGKVVDAQNKPVEGAKVTIVRKDGGNPRFEVTTKRGGDFLQVGIPSGDYVITATKDKLTQAYDVKIGLDMKEVNFSLGAAGEASKEEAAKAAARVEGLKSAFAEGAALSNAGKHDEAIAKFEQVLKEVPKCVECHTNLGSIKAAKQDYPGAEASFKEALAVNPDSVEAYNGLATLYNTQKKYKEAQAMSAEAAKRGAAAGGGGNAGALYNQAAIMWNSPDADPAKIHELLAQAIKAEPTHAESHFLMGNVLVKMGAATGDVAKFGEAATEFETYLKLAPNGPNAAKAKESFEQLKTFKK